MQQTDDERAIRALLKSWAAAVRAHDLDGVAADRTADIVMFDVPPPVQEKGIEAYRSTWPRYFEAEGSRNFELRELRIVAGADVAWAHALLRCEAVTEATGRLSVGLRKVDGRWMVAHEHHSFPAA